MAGASRVKQVAVPPAARALSMLARVDYEDAFVVHTGPAHVRTGTEWARAILEDAPADMRRSLRSGWLALGVELRSDDSEGFVLGWEVRRSTADFALLGARSRLGLLAEVLFQRRRRSVLFATFLQQQNPIARAVWTAFAPVHRRAVRTLLAGSAMAGDAA
jgi:hypothetical protein